MPEAELTTLCYISRGDDILFIHKRSDSNPNAGKYLGVGGHFEKGESPEECCRREILEETGIRSDELSCFKYRGLVTFVSDRYGVEYMHVFTAEYKGMRDVVPGNCDEGELMWIPSADIYGLPVWEGDKVMFDCLYKEEGERFFSLKLEYRGDTLAGCEKNCY